MDVSLEAQWMGRPGAETGVLAKYKELLDPLNNPLSGQDLFLFPNCVMIWPSCCGEIVCVCTHTRFTIVMSYTFSSSALSCVFSSS